MKKCLFMFFVCLIANASEITFEESGNEIIGLPSSNIDSANQYILSGKIETTSALSNSSVKIFLGDFLIEQKSLSTSGEQSILKLLQLSQNQILSSELSIDVEIPQGITIIARDIKITALKDSSLSQNELSALGISNSSYSSQSFAFVNGRDILGNSFSLANSKLNSKSESENAKFSTAEKFLNSIQRATFFVDADYGNDSLIGTSLFFDGYDGPKKTLGSALINSYAMPDGVISEIVIQESSSTYSSEILSPKAGETLIIRSEGTVVIKGTQFSETEEASIGSSN